MQGDIREWVQLVLALLAGLVSGIVAALRLAVSFQKKVGEIDVRFIEMDRDTDHKMKAQRHEIYNTVTTTVIAPLEQLWERQHNEVRDDIRALALRVGNLSEQVAVLLDRQDRKQP